MFNVHWSNIFSTCVCQSKKCYEKRLFFVWKNPWMVLDSGSLSLSLSPPLSPRKSRKRLDEVFLVYDFVFYSGISANYYLIMYLHRKLIFILNSECVFIFKYPTKNLFITFICMESLLLESHQQCSSIKFSISHYRTENQKKIWCDMHWKWHFSPNTIGLGRIINSHFPLNWWILSFLFVALCSIYPKVCILCHLIQE